jgi:two-component system sensor histidine kinase PilS (NtrC family)
MLHETLDNQEAEGLMDIILREVDRLDDLITDFLEYSRPSAISREQTDLRELVVDVLELFRNREQDITVEVVTDGEQVTPGEIKSPQTDSSGTSTTPPTNSPWHAHVDQEAIRQVLWNLLNNARDAMNDDRTASPTIRISLSHEADKIQVAVEDNGPGVDDDHRDEIFQPFFTTREEGSGLGLATSHRLVTEHDGHLSVESSTHLSGARFVIDLPKSIEGERHG